MLSDVPAMLLSSRGPLALKWNYFVKMIPWFSKYIMSCSEKKMMHTAKYMHQILDISLDAYDELFADINLDGLVEKKGIMYVWEKKELKVERSKLIFEKKLGVKQKILNPKEVHDLEPNLKPFYDGGVFYEYARHARNPKKIIEKLFADFLKKEENLKKQILTI